MQKISGNLSLIHSTNAMQMKAPRLRQLMIALMMIILSTVIETLNLGKAMAMQIIIAIA